MPKFEWHSLRHWWQQNTVFSKNQLAFHTTSGVTNLSRMNVEKVFHGLRQEQLARRYLNPYIHKLSAIRHRRSPRNIQKKHYPEWLVFGGHKVVRKLGFHNIN